MKAIADMNQHTKDKKLDHVEQAILRHNKRATTSLAFKYLHSQLEKVGRLWVDMSQKPNVSEKIPDSSLCLCFCSESVRFTLRIVLD